MTYPPGPRNPTLGLLFGERGNVLDLMQEAAAYGDFVRIPLMTRALYFVNHPDYIRYVLVENNKNYIKARGLQATRAVIGNGLLTSEGDFHTRQRRMIQPTFHRRRIATYGGVMTEYTQEHIASWQAGEQRDLYHEMMTLTMGIVAKCLFDVDVRHDAGEIGAALEGVFENFSVVDFSPLGMFMSRLPLPRSQRRKHFTRVLDTTVQGFIDERRRAGREALAERDDLLSMLLLAMDEDGTGMTDVQARDEVMTLFLAGHETTANALSWTLYLLSQHPAVEEKLAEELESVLGGRPALMDDLPNLPYNKMVFSEAMRLYPPAWIVGRQALADDEIAGYTIPAGATVLMSQYTMHRHPLFWDEPYDFIPERFANGQNETRPRYAYFPFGGGPRLCIGEPFAWMEGELLLAALVQRFRYELAPGAVIAPEPLITLRLKHGLPMILRGR
ncbi:MAG: cytochrome P450 [Anaerolineae bacterium]